MKLCDILEPLRPYVEFGCMVCLEKRNSTLLRERRSSPCALRSIRGEICDEMERVIASIENKVIENIKWNEEVPMLKAGVMPLDHQGDAYNYFRQGVKITKDVVINVGGNDDG